MRSRARKLLRFIASAVVVTVVATLIVVGAGVVLALIFGAWR